MKLNHLGVVVSDVLGASAFLETYFGLEVIGKRHRKMSHLRYDGGIILSLFEGEPETMTSASCRKPRTR